VVWSNVGKDYSIRVYKYNYIVCYMKLNLPLWYHIYFISCGFIFGWSNKMAGLTATVLYLMFAWFHITIFIQSNPMDFSNGSYCPMCKTITGMNLKHCHSCKKCVNDKWSHSIILNRCSDLTLSKRWLYLFKLSVVLFMVLSVIYSMLHIGYILLIPLHLYILKSTYMKKETSINKKKNIF